jgi:hypothetical protein
MSTSSTSCVQVRMEVQNDTNVRQFDVVQDGAGEGHDDGSEEEGCVNVRIVFQVRRTRKLYNAVEVSLKENRMSDSFISLSVR